jgi:hypothetical protein
MEIVIGLMVTVGMAYALRTLDLPPIVIILGSLLSGSLLTTILQTGGFTVDDWRPNVGPFLAVSFVLWVFMHTLTGLRRRPRA